MRPQLMDIIVFLIWLSLISIPSSQEMGASSDEQNQPGSPDSASSSVPLDVPPPPAGTRKEPGGDSGHPSRSYPPPPSPPPPHTDERGHRNPSEKTPPSDEGSHGSAGEKKQPFGKKLGIWFLGIAGGLQVATVAFLSFKRRQIRILEKSGTQIGD